MTLSLGVLSLRQIFASFVIWYVTAGNSPTLLPERIADVAFFRTMGMKAANEQALAAVNGDMCTEQAEKLRIIRSHMGSLELCKANLESLILTTVEKYLHQLDLVMTVPGSRSFALLSAQAVFLIIPKSTTVLQDS